MQGTGKLKGNECCEGKNQEQAKSNHGFLLDATWSPQSLVGSSGMLRHKRRRKGGFDRGRSTIKLSILTVRVFNLAAVANYVF